MVVSALPLGLLRYILYLSSHQPLIGKPVPASHLALTSSRLYEGVAICQFGGNSGLSYFQGTATSYLSPSNLIDSFTLSKASFSLGKSGCFTSRLQHCFSR